MNKFLGKYFLGWFIGMLLFCSVQAQDLPIGNSVDRGFSQGSIIIPLNKELQRVGGSYNLRAYGLVYALLEEGIDVSWIIKDDKRKDEPDLITRVNQINPADNSQATLVELTSSFFLIDLDQLYIESCEGESKEDFNILEFIERRSYTDIVLYETVEPIKADLRYTLHNPPSIAILDDGKYHETHIDVLNEANIPFSLLSSEAFFERATCYNVITQPHIETEQIDNQDYYQKLQYFVESGGNFIAQCSSIESFENVNMFQLTGGVDAKSIFNNTNPLSFNYFNADQTIMQFQGLLPSHIIGTVTGFKPLQNSIWRDNAFQGVTYEDYTFLSACDINGATIGGNVVYIGGHDYKELFIDEIENIKQFKRILLNSIMIPAKSNFACAGEDACICNGETIKLGCEGLSDQIEYIWTPSAGLSCTDCPNPIASPTETTTYTMRINNSNVNCGASSVTVNVLKTERFDLGDDQILCPEDSLELDATMNNASYLWENGDTTPVRMITSAGLYSVTVQTVQCSINSSIEINQVDRSFLGRDSIICDKSFEIDPMLNLDLLWGDEELSPILRVQESGTYKANILLENCEIEDSVTLRLVENETKLPSSIEKCASESILLDGGEADWIIWSTGDRTSEIEAVDTGWYYVSKRIDGCQFQDSIQIMNTGCGECNLEYPNIFSPNLDNLNDTWMLEKRDDCQIASLQISIFNRWGSQVFETTDFENRWDGTFRGQKSPIGTYIFKAVVVDIYGENYTLSGDISLVR